MNGSDAFDKSEILRKLFKERFSCVEITEDIQNKELIKTFDGGAKGKGVETFLKEKAWEDSSLGRSRVYLIKERKDGTIRAFFSLKCGMLYSPILSEQMEGEDRDFLELLIDALRENNDQLLTEYKASGVYSNEKFQEMFDEAQRIIESEREASQGIHKSYDVAVTYPAIEIENLCRNHSVESSGRIPFGFLVFWIYIIPKVLEVAKIAGCEYVYIFAADSTDEPNKGQALVRYYRTNFGFHDTEDLHFIRPRYDLQCYEMVQSVKEACDNSKNIWNQIEDIISVTTDVEEWF